MANETKATGSDEMVQIPKAQLDGIMERLAAVENKGKLQKPKRVTERFARLRFHEGKPVVAYKNVVETYDAVHDKKVALMDIYLLGESKPVQVKYLDFLNSDNSVQVQIESQKMTEHVDSAGTYRAENPDPAKVNTKTFSSQQIDLEVVSREYVATVKVLEGDLEGKTFEVPTDALNS